jgi:transposase
MTLYGGIDLHSNNNVVALTDETDRVVYRKRLANNVETVLAALAPYREEITGLVVESTYNWYWLVDALMEAGYRVHLANTSAIVQYSGLKYADDDTDAAWLAKLLRLGVLPEGISTPRPSGRYAICCAGAMLWCSSTRPTSWRCRTCSRATAGARSAPTRYGA